MRRERPITDRQREVLEFIKAHIAEKGYAPSNREISAHFGVYRNTATCHVQALVRKGYLRREPHIARGLVLVEVA